MKRSEIIAEYVHNIRCFLATNGPDERLQEMLEYLSEIT